ncbi:MAG: N-acetyltransferase family protein [Flavobacterium johnsoniae]|nr:MAG: N-acetyltransferase family protein [Flavobacterium johnsoniae]
MEIHIRTARIEDAEAILEIVNDAILNTTAIYDYDVRTLNEQLDWFREKGQQNFPVIVATDENDKVLGFGTYGSFRLKAGYKFTVEHSVYVREGFSGKGIGKLILSELIEVAKKQKLHTIIGLIDTDNAGSIAFHEKFGFEKAGVLKEAGYKFEKWLDVQLMQLLLK